MNRNQFSVAILLALLAALGAAYWALSLSASERLAQAVENERWEEVEALALEQLQTTAPEQEADLYSTLARAHSKQGEYAQALAAYRSAAEARPEDPELPRRAAIEIVKMGYTKAEDGDTEGAVADYREAAALAPLIPHGHQALAAELQNQFPPR